MNQLLLESLLTALVEPQEERLLRILSWRKCVWHLNWGAISWIRSCAKQLLLECAAKPEAEAIGQATAVILATNRKEIAGASVGDSVAWLIGTEGWSDLTEGQPRKPLLGESRVNALAITSKLSSGDALLLATDGLVKYVPPERIWAAVQRHLGVDETCAELVRLARLPNGSLQDDVGLVIMRM